MKRLFYILVLTLLVSCSSSDDANNDNVDNNPTPEELYFPPLNSDTWETVSPAELGWNDNQVQPLIDYLEDKNTHGFIILKDGKIAIEWYGNGEDANSNLPWNSAAKTLSAFTIGIAQQEGYLNINDASKEYLGDNWSSLTLEQESNISIWNHLTLTTGLDYNVTNTSCTDPECLTYLDEPITFWYYHNATYTLTHDIISGAVNLNFNTYFNEKLKNRIGMQGAWIPIGYFKLYYSNARSMARFGLLNLNQGIWDDTDVLNDSNYFNAMTNTSQSLNPSYGYFWWLNGKGSFMLPESTEEFAGSLVPNAPADMIAGLGRNDQKMYIVPSQNLVVIRMGDSAEVDSFFGPSSFDNELWEKINGMIN